MNEQSRPAPPLLAHLTVLADEAAGHLVHDPAGTYVDATFGRGGHSARILARLSPAGRLLAMDRDPEAARCAATWTDPRFAFVAGPFSGMARVLAERGIACIAGLLLDLGISSPQIDDPARGFSLRADGPLDMRMDPSSGRSAAEWLGQAGVDEIRTVLREQGDERFAASIAKALVARREAGRAPRTTLELAALVASAIPVRNRKDPNQHPATRTFQAIRIHVNQELAELEVILEDSLAVLAPQARLAVISFHSLEDRIVKRFIARNERPGDALARLPLREHELPPPLLHAFARVTPGEEEVRANPRARSAMLRVAVRTVARAAAPRPAGGGR
jgi:16S rRNA (cytosine1402-N4)-methyltransferase